VSSPRWVFKASGAQIVAVVSGAVTNLLYARLLPLEDVGRLAVIIALASALGVLADLGLQILLTREVASGQLSAADAAGVLLAWLPVLLVGWWLMLVGVLAVQPDVVHSLGVRSGNVVLVLEWAFTFLLFQCTSSLAQAMGRFNIRSALMVANALATTSLTGALLLLDASLPAAVHASALAYASAAVIGGLVLTRGRPVRLMSITALRKLARSARPIWTNAMLTFVIVGADVIFASLALSLAEVGQYQILKKVALSLTAPMATLLPLFFARFSSAGADAREAMYRRVQARMALLVGAGVLVVAPVIEPAVRLAFGPQYAPGAELTLVLIVSALMLQSAGLLGYLLTAAGQLRLPVIMNVLAVTVLVVSANVLFAGRGLAVFAACLLAANTTCLLVGVFGGRRFGLSVVDRGTREALLLCGGALAGGLAVATAPTLIAVPLALVGTGLIAWRAIILTGFRSTAASERNLAEPLG
jgi:O-antigen/teichoic acid export membrane protein